MSVISVVWRDCHQLIEGYNEEQVSLLHFYLKFEDEISVISVLWRGFKLLPRDTAKVNALK